MKARNLLFCAAAALLAIILIPLPQTVAPDWIITTLDADHRPLNGITVREVWQQYSLEHSSHEEDRLTDIEGKYTSLGAQIGRASWADVLVAYGKLAKPEFTRAVVRIHTW